MKSILKKILVITSLFLIVVTSFGCGNKKESYNLGNEKKIILRLAETQPLNYPSTRGDLEFARLVEQKSEGRIKVKVYDSSRLGDEASVVEQLQFGGIDMARVSLSSLTQYSATSRITMLPYIIKNRDHMWRVFDGPIGQEIKGQLFKEKILCLAWFDGGTKGFYNSKKPIYSINDLKGLKINVQRSQILMNMYSFLGMSLVPTQRNGIYNAIQTGFIDGAEDSVVTYFLGKHFEVANYFANDEHLRIPEVLIASRVATMQLSKKDKLLIEQAAQESAVIQRKIWLDAEFEALKTLNNLGVVITYFDEKSRAEFLEAMKPFYNGFKSEEIRRVILY